MKFYSVSILLILFVGGLVINIALMGKSCGETGSGKSEVPRPVAASGTASATKSPDPSIRTWIPANFLGIKLGQSTEQDVIKSFGKPAYKGRAKEGDDETSSAYGAEDEIALEFHYARDDNGRLGNITFILAPVARDVRRVREISFDLDRQLTIDEAISEFGSNFFQIDFAGYAGSSCITENIPIGTINQDMRFPAFVYPNKGLTLMVNPDTNRVAYYYYSYTCQNTH